MRNKVEKARERIKNLPLDPELKKRLLNRLKDCSSASSSVLETFLSKLDVLEGWQERLEIQAKIGELTDRHSELLRKTKQEILEDLQQKKTEDERGEIKRLKEKIAMTSSDNSN